METPYNPSASTATRAPYYTIAPLKVVLLSLATFGLYNLFWFYKQWTQIRESSGKKLSPVWRAFFSPIWSFSFFSEVENDLDRHGMKLPVPAVLLGIVFFITISLGRFENILGWVYFLHSVPLVVGQIYANRLVRLVQPDAVIDRRWGFGSGIIMTLGAIAWGLVILGTFGTATAVQAGSEMDDNQVDYLVSKEYIEPDENIVYFYSAGAWSIHEDGNIITDRRIVSYENTGGEEYYASINFEDIYNIDVIYSDDWLEDTQVIVTNTFGEEVYLVVSIENGLDKVFVRRIEREWRKRVPEGEEELINPPLEESEEDGFKVVI